MIEKIEHIAQAIKAARNLKGLSQRELGLKTKIPQSHLSKIENGTIDLKTSSLIEIGRVLDLELMLVPRKLVPAFEALMRGEIKDKQIPMFRPDWEDRDE